MKRILTSLALIAAVTIANAQVKSAADIQKAIQKAEAVAQNAKKASNPDTWIKLGQAYKNAYDNPTANVVGGSKAELQLVMGNDKPISTEMVELGGQQYEKVVYKDKNLYFDPSTGGLVITEVTHPSYDGDALGKALDAFRKAAELDAAGKKKKAITDALTSIAKSFNQEAFNAYYLGNASKASQLFAKSAEAAGSAPLSQLDTASIYFAGITALEAQEYDRAKTFFDKAIENDYFSKGAVFANLYECAMNQKDTLTARAFLEEGFQKFPENPQVLTSLINLYIALNEDPAKLIDLLNKAKKELPDNPSLYYVEGDIYGRLKDYDNAVKAYRQAAVVDPNYDMGFYGEGLMWFNRAVAIQDEAANLPYNEYKKYDELQEELKASLKNAIEPFEKCFAVTKNDVVKTGVADFLKRIYFIFRNESADYQAAYEKYNSFLENAAK